MSEVRPIADVAADLGIASKHIIPYGDDKAKIRLEALNPKAPRGKLILVSAVTPTSAGEGKTTTSIGLAQGLAKIGKRVCLALREPSLGPTFGVKGGATGGGKSIVVPADDINLHFTGDFHAMTSRTTCWLRSSIITSTRETRAVSTLARFCGAGSSTSMTALCAA